jgi:hypothetical protein
MGLSNASVAPKAESRGEFEALKRFGDYEELHDGTLMRVEADMEFRIYCEDVEGCPIGIVTQGVLNVFADLYDEEHPREANDAGEQRGVTSGRCDCKAAERVRNRLSKRLRRRLPAARVSVWMP